jgi:hypothetical protein
MIIVNLKGGLGNQMFQYAAGRRLAEKHKTDLKLDLSFLSRKNQGKNVTLRSYELSVFNVQENIATPEDIRPLKNFTNRLRRKIFPNKATNPYVQEKFHHFDPEILMLGDNKYLDGHWMSERYFADVEPVIRKEFAFKKGILEAGKNLETLIRTSNSVCIQVRRGDYVTNPTVAKVHGSTSVNYFEKGIEHIRNNVQNPVFFVFSDDSKWCMETFSGLSPVFFIEKELESFEATNSDYLQLMTHCKHFLISNSTFAWWGAWLSINPEKIVVAPKNWFNLEGIDTNDICPPSWIKI